MKTFGQFLETLRNKRPVQSVSEATGIPRSTLFAWESDTVRPPPERVGALLDLYGATDEERLEAWRLRSMPRDATSEITDGRAA